MDKQIEVGRLLRTATTGFVAGCRVNQLLAPAFGALVRAPLGAGCQVYGLIHDIHIADDGLVRQLVTAEGISEEVLLDNRQRRIVPVELSVLAVGHEQDGQILPLLPPRPPLSLDVLFLCNEMDLVRFTASGRLGYFRHLLRSDDLPVAELVAAHIRMAHAAHRDGGRWKEQAIQEIISLMRDDHAGLMSVLGALSEIL
jgi:hypothetical protein